MRSAKHFTSSPGAAKISFDRDSELSVQHRLHLLTFVPVCLNGHADLQLSQLCDAPWREELRDVSRSLGTTGVAERAMV